MERTAENGREVESIVERDELAGNFSLLEETALLRRCCLNNSNWGVLTLEAKCPATIAKHWIVRNVVMHATHTARFGLPSH